MDIREFEEKNRLAVIDLWHQCQLVSPTNDPDKDIDRKLRRDPELFLVGHIGETVISTVMGGYEGHRGWINYLAVHPQHQRRGYAKALMDAIEQRLLDIGCPKINLQVRTSNQNVIGFYNTIGYQVDPVTSFGKRLIKD